MSLSANNTKDKKELTYEQEMAIVQRTLNRVDNTSPWTCDIDELREEVADLNLVVVLRDRIIERHCYLKGVLDTREIYLAADAL